MIHRHSFVETERFHTPRIQELANIKGGDPRDIERFVFGVRTILYICTGCGEPKTIEILGGHA